MNLNRSMEPQEPQEEARPVGPTRTVRNRLFDSRIVLISGEINQRLAERVMAELLALSADSDEDITLIINSQGGHVESGDTIHDMIKFVKPRVKIVGTGWVASAGALIYIAADKDSRFCLPNTRFLLHQPMGGIRGQGSDIAIEAEQIVKMRERLNKMFADATSQPYEKIEKDTQRNFWLTPQEAIEYGLVTRVIENIAEIE